MTEYKNNFDKDEDVNKWISNEKVDDLLDKCHGGVFYAETPKFGMLYYNKVGSRFITTMFENNQSLKVNGIKIVSKHSQEKTEFFRQNQNQWAWATKHQKDRGVLKESIADFEKITNGTSEKDLVIVTRNPKLKLLSGMIQDINIHGDIHFSHQLFFKGYINKHYPSVLGIKTYEELKKIHPKIWEDILEQYLIGWFSEFSRIRTSEASHGKVGFNETYYKFLELNPINLDKLTIVDIDSIDGNLETPFKKYHNNLNFPKTIEPMSNKSKYSDMIYLLKKIGDNQKYSKLIESIEWEVSRDYFYYNLIKEKYGK